MTIQELAAFASESPALVGGVLAAPPLLALLAALPGRDPMGESPRRYLFSLLIYLVCIPGILAVVTTGYIVFFQNMNLLELDLLFYFGPIATMVATLALIKRTTELDRVPGFGRIGGMMVMMTAAFAAAFILQRTHIWVVFGGGLGSLLILGLGLYLLITVGWRRMMGGRVDERTVR